MSAVRPVEVRPAMGGRLMTGVSSENAGLYNYTIKRDFRRVLDQEVVSEGHDWFLPDPSQVTQPAVNGEPITLIAGFHRPNGKTAVVVGTKSTLFRYFGLEDPRYVDDDYIEAGYYQDEIDPWAVIGSGFSTNGRRWEALSINGYLVLNNGVDLPMTYRVEELEVKPIYELREQGIASVGTIASMDGILMAADLSQLTADKLTEIMTPTAAAVNGSQAGVVRETVNGTVNSGAAGTPGNALTVALTNLIAGAQYGAIPGCSYVFTGLLRGHKYVLVMDAAPTLVQEGILQGDGSWLNPVGLAPQAGVPLEFTAHGNAITVIDVPRAGQELPGALYESSAFVLKNGFKSYAVGAKIRMANGLTRTIVSVDSIGQVTLDGAADLAEPAQPIYLPTDNDWLLGQTAAQLFPGTNMASLPGRTLFWDNGAVRKIVSVDDAGHIQVDSDWPIAAGALSIDNPAAYATFTDATYLERYKWRVVPSMPEQPRRFAAVIPCTVDPTSNIVRLQYPVRSIEQDMPLVVADVGVGANGGTLQAGALFVGPSGTLTSQVMLDNGAVTAAAQTVTDTLTKAKVAEVTAQAVVAACASTLVTRRAALAAAKAAQSAKPKDDSLAQATADASTALDAAIAAANSAAKALTDATTALSNAQQDMAPVTASLMAGDAGGSIAGKYSDLIGDGTGILKMLSLGGDYLVAYKESTIFIGQYTADTTMPFQWKDLETPAHTALVHRNTLVAVDGRNSLMPVNGVFHLYAGANAFYRFDAVNRVPVEVPELQVCQELFFANADDDFTFAADNQATHEIFICFPSDGPDKALRFDYRFGTVSTTSAAFTAAAMVARPEAAIPDRSELWFAMGTSDGLVLRYGLVAGKPQSSGTIQANKTGRTVRANAPFFTPAMVGKSIRFASGSLYAITRFVDAMCVEVLDRPVVAIPPGAILGEGGEALGGENGEVIGRE